LTVQQVQENTGFPIDGTRAVESPAPSSDELRILREEVDPQHLILK
jgi:glutaconate CoA-transferase subunit B